MDRFCDILPKCPFNERIFTPASGCAFSRLPSIVLSGLLHLERAQVPKVAPLSVERSMLMGQNSWVANKGTTQFVPLPYQGWMIRSDIPLHLP